MIDTKHQAAASAPDAAEDVTLSVVMPNYNHAEFLPISVAAILSQLQLPDEIVIVDDGSTDQSRSVLERLASAEPRIRLVFNSKNNGAIHSINRGLQVSRGKYVCLMAADDVAYPDFFSTAMVAFKRFPNVALFCAEADVQLMDNRRAQANTTRNSPQQRAARIRSRGDQAIAPIQRQFHSAACIDVP